MNDAELEQRKLRLAIATDEPVSCNGIQSVLGDRPEIRLLWLPTTEAELKATLLMLDVHLLLVDMACGFMPDIEASLRKNGFKAPLILWQRTDSAKPTETSNRMPPCITLDKRATPSVLLACVEALLAGTEWDDSVDASLFPTAAVVSRRVSPREAELINLAAEGLSNREISTRLGLAEGSVKVYFSRLFHKLGVNDRVGLILFSMQYPFSRGLKRRIQPPERPQELQ